jgi:hypothetical protein
VSRYDVINDIANTYSLAASLTHILAHAPVASQICRGLSIRCEWLGQCCE